MSSINLSGRNVDVILYIGYPGCGKSSKVSIEYPTAYYKNIFSNFWDGYNGQDSVVLDDFNGYLPYDKLLNMLHSSSGNIYGSKIPLNFTKFVITSNNTPWCWYSDKYNSKFIDMSLFNSLVSSIYYWPLNSSLPIIFTGLDSMIDFRNWYNSNVINTSY